jgi:drug/metabolite transporter (DMT)-like permease
MTFALGVAAALAAPFVMTIGFFVWEDHWKGSAFALNLFKCNFVTPLSLLLVLVATTTSRQQLFSPEIFTVRAVGHLMLSSVIGIVIGDWAWLRGLQILGARRVILMDSLKPFLAALFGWIILDEDLRLAALGGIVLTVAGVLIVSLEKEPVETDEASTTDKNDTTRTNEDSAVEEPPTDHLEQNETVQQESIADMDTNNNTTILKGDGPATEDGTTPSTSTLRIGYALSILNVALDTYASVLTKQHGQQMTVWEIILIRFGFAGIVMMALSLVLHLRAWFLRSNSTRNLPSADDREEKDEISWYSLPSMTKSSWFHVSGGVVLVTFLTPALSNYALFEIALALALTLTSVGPLYSLPLSFLLQKNVPTSRSLAGAVLAVAGVLVLAFRGTTPQDE